MPIDRTPACGAVVEGPQWSQQQLNQELDALRAVGHVLSPWSAADPELAPELELLDSARQCTCACGLILLAGSEADGACAFVRGVGAVYDARADQRTVDADLEARWHGPCPAAPALADFHASAGYQRFAECYND